MNFQITPCQPKDSLKYTEHIIRHMKERGIGGVPVAPFSKNHSWDLESRSASLNERWSRPLLSPNFEMAWMTIHNNEIVGHIDLRSGSIEATCHRLKLGIGIEDTFRSKGLGTALCETAITWAKGHVQVTWIDLQVFENNFAARALYKKLGFKELYCAEDALRIDGQKINDVQMVLKLR